MTIHNCGTLVFGLGLILVLSSVSGLSLVLVLVIPTLGVATNLP